MVHSPDPNNTKTIERITCHCFLRPIRSDLSSEQLLHYPPRGVEFRGWGGELETRAYTKAFDWLSRQVPLLSRDSYERVYLLKASSC